MIEQSVIDSFFQEINEIKKSTDNWSWTRDVFDARLQSYNRSTENWLYGAVIGEIGFNTFDHNLGYSSDLPKGLYCNFMFKDKYAAMLDFGRGLRSSLSRTVPCIKDDLEAIQIAFTKQISGRAPEQRGNGLKFVLTSLVSNNWEMYYQSGNAVCTVDGSGYSIEESCFNHSGCFCILRGN